MMKGVILAAGKSTRLQPVTENISKCMLPVGGRPILEYSLDSMNRCGIHEIAIVVNSSNLDHIKNHFGDTYGNAHLTYIVQDERRRGSAAALMSALPFFKGEDALVIAGDVIAEFPDVKSLIDFHVGHKGAGSMLLAQVSDPKRYGIAQLDGDKVVDIIEKPANPKTNLANASVYVMSARFAQEIEKVSVSERGEYEITSALYELCNEGLLYGLIAKWYWNDIGTPWGLLSANELFMERLAPSIKGSVKESTITGNVVIEEGAQVFNSYIEGPCYISRGAIVGPFAHIRKYTYLGPNVEVGGSTIVKNSILLEGTKAKHLSYIGDSIIGTNCNFGSSTQVANLRFDRGTIKMFLNGNEYDSGRHKLGCVVGPNVNFGVGSLIMPGRKIGGNSIISPGAIISNDVPPNTRVIVKQSIEHIPLNSG